MAFIWGLLHFYKLVFICTTFSALYSLSEMSMPPRNLTMKSEGLEFILSWEPGNNIGTTYYRVMYKPSGTDCLIMHQTPSATHSKSPKRDQVRKASLSKRGLHHFKVAEECSNITRLFCNLTKEFTEFCRMYLILVEQFTENGTQVSFLNFSPYMQTCLPPPWFEIAACPNCINVTIKLSSSLLEIYKGFDYTVKLIKEGFTETLIKKKDTRDANFHTVVPDLSPNTNYCISVDVSSITKQCIPSALKCLVTSSKDKSGLIASTVVVGILMMVSVMFSLFFLLRAGFVCLRERWPEVLNIKHTFSDSLVPLDPDAQGIQIIQKGKRKGTEYDYEDECESDEENVGGYTHHGLLRNISKSCSKADSTKQLSIDSSSVGSDCHLLGAVSCELDAGHENLSCHPNEENKTGQTCCSTSELTSLPEPETSVSLNINLNTVTVGLPDRNWDAGATRSSYEEEAADLQEPFVSSPSESKLLTERKDMQHSEVHNISYTQQNSDGSEESESSDSETNCVGEYMRR